MITRAPGGPKKYKPTKTEGGAILKFFIETSF